MIYKETVDANGVRRDRFGNEVISAGMVTIKTSSAMNEAATNITSIDRFCQNDQGEVFFVRRFNGPEKYMASVFGGRDKELISADQLRERIQDTSYSSLADRYQRALTRMETMTPEEKAGLESVNKLAHYGYAPMSQYMKTTSEPSSAPTVAVG